MAKGISACITPFCSFSPTVWSSCFPCLSHQCYTDTRSPQYIFFPRWISWKASSGHKPFPPNCVCCLSTMMELLIQSKLATMKSHTFSIRPVSFYEHLKYSSTALHLYHLQSHLTAQPENTIPVELSWTQKVTSGAGTLHHWGKMGWWRRQHLTCKAFFFHILRGQHGCTWVKPLPANKNILLCQNIIMVILFLPFEGMRFNQQILSSPQPAWKELVNDKDHWHLHSPTSSNAQLLFGWLLLGRNQFSASPLEGVQTPG